MCQDRESRHGIGCLGDATWHTAIDMHALWCLYHVFVRDTAYPRTNINTQARLSDFAHTFVLAAVGLCLSSRCTVTCRTHYAASHWALHCAMRAINSSANLRRFGFSPAALLAKLLRCRCPPNPKATQGLLGT